MDLTRFDTEVLLRVLRDPINAKDPEQAERNAQTLEAIQQELQKRGVQC